MRSSMLLWRKYPPFSHYAYTAGASAQHIFLKNTTYFSIVALIIQIDLFCYANVHFKKIANKHN